MLQIRYTTLFSYLTTLNYFKTVVKYNHLYLTRENIQRDWVSHFIASNKSRENIGSAHCSSVTATRMQLSRTAGNFSVLYKMVAIIK